MFKKIGEILTKMDKKRIDNIFGFIFLLAIVIIIYYFFSDERFFYWAFERHQNILSWYIRPIFIIPIILGAYFRSFSLIFLSIFSLFTSMFWFPVPDKVDEKVISFLNFEKEYLTSGWATDKVVIIFTILLFFIFLIYATWKKNWKLLVSVILIGATLKVVHSVFFSGSGGTSIIKPAVTGAILCIIGVLFIKNRNKNNS